MVDIPVLLVDTGVGSFPVALAVWAAAERTANDTGSLFVVGVPAVARRGGRFVSVSGDLTPTTVLELTNGELLDRGAAPDVAERIRARLETELPDSEIVLYEVGPSVGAHTGPGTLGIVHTPVSVPVRQSVPRDQRTSMYAAQRATSSAAWRSRSP